MKLANEILKEAEKNIEKAAMRSSAELCLLDCKYWIKDGDERFSIYHGLKSISYSLGIFSETYKRLCRKAEESGFSDYVPGKKRQHNLGG